MRGRFTFLLLLVHFAFGTAYARSSTLGTEAGEILPPIDVIDEKPLKAVPDAPSEFRGETLEIDSSPERTLPQILRNSTAVTVRESGGEGAAASFLIRGQDPIQNRYFLEGIPLTDAEFNSANLGLLPIESLSRVDIYPEGIPIFLGEDGLGGAMQFHLAPLSTYSPNTFGTRLGSYDYLKVFGDGVLRTSNPARLHLEYNQSQEDFFYWDDNGTPFDPSAGSWQVRQHNQFRRFSALPEITLRETSTYRLHLLDLLALGNTDVPGSIEIPAEGNLKQVYELAAVKLETGRGESVQSDSNLYWRLDSENFQNNATGSSPASYLSDSQSLTVGARTNWRFEQLPIPGVELVSGATWDSYRVALSSVSQDNSAKSRWQIPVGVGANIPVHRRFLTVKPAIMGHYFQYALGGTSAFSGTRLAGPSENSYFLVSPRMGILSNPFPALQLRAAAGSYYRAPTMMELFGEPAGISPSPNLRYERALKGEVGFDFAVRHPLPLLSSARFSYTFSESHAHDLISYIQNSQQTQVATNVGESQIKSHEFELLVETPVRLDFRAGVSLLSTTNLTDSPYQFGNQLPGRPDYQGNLGVSFHWGNLGVDYTLTLIGPTYWDVANLKQMDATSEHSVFISWNAKSYGVFILELRNLANSMTADTSLGGVVTVDNTTGYMGYPAPGRRVYLSWKCEI